MQRNTLFITILGLAAAQLVQRHSDLNPDLLSKKIQKLTEHSLKYIEIQSYFDNLDYSHQKLQGQDLLTSLATTFQDKVTACNSAVIKLRDAIQVSYNEKGDSTTGNLPCCKQMKGSLTYNPLFKQKVGMDTLCYQVAATSTSEVSRLKLNFKKTCQENMRSAPSLKWQYFGSTKGVTTIFPALEKDCNLHFENRFRPWYVQANAPKPKRIVIILDKSRSMNIRHDGKSFWDLAKKAANTVIDTLNRDDMFAVIVFSDNADLVNKDCHSLALATPRNKQSIKTSIEKLVTGGGSQYNKALNLAFDLLSQNHDANMADEIDTIMLFMTDGKPTDSESTILRTLRRRNLEINNTAVIMTYGIGNEDFNLLKVMVEENYRSSSLIGAQEAVVGKFTIITNPNNLINQMASYYNHFAEGETILDQPVWTPPYLDGWGLGTMITASLPVYHNNDLVGVAAVDITIEELLAESTYFRPNDLSYSFVINDKGILINHPMLPQEKLNEPLLVTATVFERDPEFLSVYESMKRGESGNKTFESTRVISQGDSRSYGVEEIKVESVYYWKQIKHTKFSVCLVLVVNDTQSVLLDYKPRSFTFLYHRLDLVPPSAPCNHLCRLSSMNESSVFLAARAFEEPENHLYKQYSVNDIKEIFSYMEDQPNSKNTMQIKRQVKAEVRATYHAQTLWTKKDENTDLQEQVMWRYIGTKTGVFRIYPAAQLPKNFQPVLRPWYEHALANRNSNIITPPYSDITTGAPIITLSRVLYEGRKSGKHDSRTDEVVGVLGVDIMMSYFQTILRELYLGCNETYRCLVVDKAGYVIIADEYIDTSKSTNNQLFEKKHLIQLAPEIAFALIKENILQKISCTDVEAAMLQKTYKMTMTNYYQGNTAGLGHCKMFQLWPIHSTNTFLLVQELTETYFGCNLRDVHCACGETNSTCKRSWKNDFCECPCQTLDGHYLPCLNQYIVSNDSEPPCTPENPKMSSVAKDKIDLKLAICYPVAFDICKTEGRQKSNAGLIAGTTCGIVIFLIVCIAIFVVMIRYKRKKNQQIKSEAHSDNNCFGQHRNQNEVPQDTASHQEALPPPNIGRCVQRNGSYDVPPPYQSQAYT